MSTGDSVSCVLWISQLSPLLHLGVVAQIWQSSRERNQRLGLTGVMVFDGERFCEMLEGDADELETVCRDVAFDTRHVGMRLLYAAIAPVPRRLSEWRCGYCEAPELACFSDSDGLEGEPAIAAFLSVLPRFNLSP
jgi:hypothetical protein